MDPKTLILDFIGKQKLAVISTVGPDSKPESAVLEFGQTDNLELIFDTFNTARKYQNLQTNSNVSFVIGWDESITVQYEGLAKELAGEEAQTYQEMYWQKNPDAKRWASRSGITYFKVTPTWVRYSDLSTDPWTIIQLPLKG